MRRSSLFWGVMVLVAGIILMLINWGFLPYTFGQLFWPIAIILAGVWLLVGPYLSKRSASEESVSIPLEGAVEAIVQLNHGAGRVEVSALDSSTELMAGSFFGGVETEINRSEGKVRLHLNASGDAWAFPGPMHPGFSWKFGLNRNIPLQLEVKSGASQTTLNLADLRVTELKIDTGASATEVTLPTHPGFIRMVVHSGASSLNIHVPEGVSAQITIKSGLAGIHVNPARFARIGDNLYQSADYATAMDRAEIHVETGVGSVDIG